MATDYPKVDPRGMDPRAVVLKENQVLAALCRASFYDFVREFWSTVVAETPVWNWHIKYLCDQMQAAAEPVFLGRPRKHDLAVNIPPGTSKSTIVSVMFPPWTWTRMPSARHICTSYSYPLAMGLSVKSRDVVTSDLYRECFPKIGLREDQNTKAYFQNTAGGFRMATGVGGTVTGYHAHFINIDDPINPQQAASEIETKAANVYLRDTLSTRKVDKSVTLTTLLMQRLGKEDCTAMFLKQPKVKHICIPAELTPDVKPPYLRQYYKGGLMDPVRLNAAVLEEEKTKGAFMYAGQFLQSPVPPGGLMFLTNRLLKNCGPPPRHFLKLVRYWDKAGTAGDGAYTVGVKMGVDTDGRFWVLDVQRFQEEVYERERLIRQVARQDGIRIPIGLEQEPGSGGKDSGVMGVRNLSGYKVQLFKVGQGKQIQDKVTRAQPFAAQVNGGTVWMAEAGWNEAFIDELKFFPHVRLKDQVDAAVGAFGMVDTVRRRVGGLRRREQVQQILKQHGFPEVKTTKA